MPRVFDDPEQELEFIAAVEEELERLAVGGVLDAESSRRANHYYQQRRLLLSQRMEPTPTVVHAPEPGDVVIPGDYVIPDEDEA